MNSYVGSEVTVILREGSYHGIIHRFDSVDKRITLKDVSDPVNGNKYPGLRHFYASEILDLVVDEDYDESVEGPPCAVIHTDEIPAYEDAAIDTSDDYDSFSTTNKVSDSPPALSCDKYTIIEKFNDQFQNTMSLIQDQVMIGFHLVSIGEGRNGKICWIAISIEKHAYLFDFLALGKKLFKKGLQDVLENKKITKIIHDCRFISDLLFHKYSVNLSNVFDTQVADAFAHRAWYGIGQKNAWPKFVQPLSVCLFSHLKLPTEKIAGINAREGRTKVEQELWPQRPLSVPLAETLYCSVTNLAELRLLLLEKMMVEYTAGVDIYLSSVRDLPHSEVSWYASKSEFLPKNFGQMNRFTQVIKDSFKIRGRESPSGMPLLENNLERKEIIQQMRDSNKMDNNSKYVPHKESAFPDANPENTDIPSSLTSTTKNKLSLGSPPANQEQDLFNQVARNLIADEIPSSLMDLMKIPEKNPSVVFDPKIFDDPDTTTHNNNSSSSSNQSRVEWSRLRKDSLNQNKFSLQPASCSIPTEKNTKDILIHENRKMIPTDIPSAKNSSVVFDPKIFNDPDTATQNNSSSSSNQSRVEWSRFRKDSLNQNEFSLQPASCSIPADRKTKDVLIQENRKMIPTDIPSAKNSSILPDPNPKTFNNPDTTTQNNSSTSPNQTVEWGRFRKDVLNRTKLSLQPAGSNSYQKRTLSKQSKQSIQRDKRVPVQNKNQPKSCQQLNNENKSPINKSSFDSPLQNSNPDYISDKYFEIPDSEHDSGDNNVLGQIQTYSVSRQPFQHTAKRSCSYSDNDTNNNINSIDSPSHTRTEPKSQVLSSTKAEDSTKISSQELPSRTENSSSPGIPAEVQMADNGASRNYWVTGSGIMGSGGMTHIERLTAIWRNNCK